MPKTPAELRDQWVLDHAEYFTAYTFYGADQMPPKARIECPTLEAAMAQAKRLAAGNDRGALVYAVYGSHQALLATCPSPGRKPL